MSKNERQTRTKQVKTSWKRQGSRSRSLTRCYWPCLLRQPTQLRACRAFLEAVREAVGTDRLAEAEQLKTWWLRRSRRRHHRHRHRRCSCVCVAMTMMTMRTSVFSLVGWLLSGWCLLVLRLRASACIRDCLWTLPPEAQLAYLIARVWVYVQVPKVGGIMKWILCQCP